MYPFLAPRLNFWCMLTGALRACFFKKADILSHRFYFCICTLISGLLYQQPLPAQVSEEWVKRYNNSTASGTDHSTALTVDKEGNLYVIGTSDAFNYSGFALVKYDPEGNQVWENPHVANSLGKGNFVPTALMVDDQQHVYATGYSVSKKFPDDPTSVTTIYDYTTVKFDAQGNQVWVQQYDHLDNLDQAWSISLDTLGNVMVAGSNIDSTYANNITVVTYTSQGTQLSAKSITLPNSIIPGTSFSQKKAITIDTQGYIYVAGEKNDHSGDYVTVKYDAQGSFEWEKFYSTPDSLGYYMDDRAQAIFVDRQGYVYITGYTCTPCGYLTLKYDSQGNSQWARRYDKTPDSRGESIEIDALGNVYVAGYSQSKGTRPVVKYDSAGNELWAKELAYSDYTIYLAAGTDETLYITGDGFITGKYNKQGTQVWKKDYNSTTHGNDFPRALATDKQGNVYVAAENIVKYDTQGNELWVTPYKGPVQGTANAIAIDSKGNVYVTGGYHPSLQVATVKYDSAGKELWNKNLGGTTIVVDEQDHVYVTGYTSVIRVDPQGNQLWKKEDIGNNIVVDKQGNVYIGTSTVGKYDLEGNQIWSTADVSTDFASMAVDEEGNVYTAFTVADFEAGCCNNDKLLFSITTKKLDSQGKYVWEKTQPAGSIPWPGFVEQATSSLATDKQGNVYVAGYSLTLKYNSTGELLWNKSSAGRITGLAVDTQSNVYTTGYTDSEYDKINSTYATIKYSTNGDILWTASHTGDHRGGDTGSLPALELDDQGNVFVAGFSTDSITKADIITIKYKQASFACNASGTILQEVWLGINGSLISDIPINTHPSASYQLTSFETATNQGNNYGERIRGYLCVPQNGNYTFYIAGDDRCELYLSTDEDPAKKIKIASVPYFTGVRQWDKYPSQQSSSIYLVAGKKYYIEALHKEGPYLDNLAVGWQASSTGPVTVIDGSYLSPYIPQGEGKLTREYWANISGSLVSDIPLSTPATITDEISGFETATNQGNHYGQRLRGFLHPQVSGNYTFYIAGDDRCELYLSTDEDPAKKIKIASVPYFTGVRQWDKYPSQQSSSIYLVAGKKYYIEALHKEGLYADNLAIAWMMPGQTFISVIEGKFLSPFLPKVSTIARTGIQEPKASPISTLVYPNPFTDKLTISTQKQGLVYINLIDNLGRVLIQTAQIANQDPIQLNLEKMKITAGIYFLMISSQDGYSQMVRMTKK